MEERDCLEKTVEEVLYAEGIFTACDINLKLLNGCVSDISWQGQNDKAVLLLWIFYVFVLSCVCYVFVRVCLYVLCGHLLGKG